MKNLKVYSSRNKQLYIIGIGNVARKSILNLSGFNLQNIKYSIITQSFNNSFGYKNTDSINIFSKSFIRTKNSQKDIKIKPKTISDAINPNLINNLRNNILLAKKVFLIAKISSDFEALIVPEIAKIAKEEGIDIKCIILNPFVWEGTYINNVARKERQKLDSLMRESVVLSINNYDFYSAASFSVEDFLNELSERLTFALINELKTDIPNVDLEYNLYSNTDSFKFRQEELSSMNIKNFEYNSDTNKWKFY